MLLFFYSFFLLIFLFEIDAPSIPSKRVWAPTKGLGLEELIEEKNKIVRHFKISSHEISHEIFKLWN